MKRNLLYYTLISMFAFSLLTLPYMVAYAQDSSDESASVTSSQEETVVSASVGSSLKDRLEAQKERLSQMREDIEEKIKNRKEEVQKKLEEAKIEIIRKHVSKMFTRFEAAINRLDNVYSRIWNRINILEDSDKDVSKVKAALEAVKPKIDSARSKLSEARSSFETVMSSETPKDALDEARIKLEELKTIIIEIHMDLVDVINSIKGSSEETK